MESGFGEVYVVVNAHNYMNSERILTDFKYLKEQKSHKKSDYHLELADGQLKYMYLNY